MPTRGAFIRVICTDPRCGGIRYLPDMRHGLRRSLAALVGGTAFAVSVAGPVQWDPCPTHGVGVLAQAEAPPAATMDMPAGEAMPPALHAHASHGSHMPDSHHGAHQCTCAGCCCGSWPVALRTNPLRASLDALVASISRVDHPSDAVELASSPQLVLPFAHAPPAVRVTLQHAAISLT
jgi:hypothetical protein